jgi:hypothetical protein
MPSEVVGKFPVRGNHVVLCRVEYHKGRGYFFCADPVQEREDGITVINLGMVMAGRMELLQDAKRFSQKTFDSLVHEYRLLCRAEDPRVMRHVAEATERVPQEVSNASS